MKSLCFLAPLFCFLLIAPLSHAQNDALQQQIPFTTPLAQITKTVTGEAVEPSVLEGKTLAFYFSAHWCPPCRAFTPTLVNFYHQYKDDGLEIIFVSFDNSKSEKQKYIKEANMPWLMLEGNRTKKAEALAKLFQIPGYPSLVIVRPDGSLATNQGTYDVMLDPKAALKKWQAPAQP